MIVNKGVSGNITVSFPYNPQLVEKVKTIPDRKWHLDKKHWSFPNSDGTLEKILKVFEGEEIHIDSASRVKSIPSTLRGDGKGETRFLWMEPLVLKKFLLLLLI